MAEYPGNPALSAEVKQKILTTFRHTVSLYQAGKKEDTVVGCEFILKMDARFSPAQQLLLAAKNGTPIDPAALLASLEAGAPGDLLDRARAALDERDFSKAIALAQQALSANPRDADASDLVTKAQELVEAQPFVGQFIQKAREALSKGDTGEASRQADKAWSIDPTHPDLKAVRAAIAEAMAPGGGGFEFQGEPEAPIGIAESGENGFGFEPAAPDAFGFQFAPEEDLSSMPTIGIAPEVSAEPEQESAAPVAFSFDAPASGAPAAFSFDEAPAPAAPPPKPAAAPAPPPAPPPKAAEPAAFDFSAATSLDNPFMVESGQNEKVTQLLQEGDRAFDSGDLQGAIDIWSRIFLIDVTSMAASERIDKAKKSKQERDQKIDVIVAEGARLMQSGQSAEAKAKLAEALAIDPGNASARAYIEQIDSGGGPKASGETRTLGPSTARPVDSGKDILSEDILGDFVPPGEEEGPMEGLYEGGPSEEGVFPEDREGAPGRVETKKKSIPVPIILAAVALLGLIGFALWFFVGRTKGGGTGTGVELVTGEKRVNDAIALHKLGKIDEAIGELLKVAANDPAYSRSLGLIDEYKKEVAKRSATSPPPALVNGRPAAEVALELKEKGKAAIAASKYLEAMPLIDQANRFAPGDPETEGLLKQVTEKVTGLQNVLKAFNEGNYEAAVKLLWQMRQSDPNNNDVNRLLVNSYYNMGISELQSGTKEKAAEDFKEILNVKPDDVEVQRHLKIAERYRTKQNDLMYKIYTKSLQPRASSSQ